MKRAALGFVLLVIACSTRAPRRVITSIPQGPDRLIRVSLAAADPRLGGTDDWAWYEEDGTSLITRGRGSGGWRLEREPGGSRVRALRPDGTPTTWQRALVARAGENGFITVNSKRYRGDILVLPADSALLVVNRLPLESYLRGVVPLEMGSLPRRDSAALQAQAVASRSYAVLRFGDHDRPWDVRASTQDQVYGGVGVESDAADAAVDATRGLVLRYQGRVVDAPFHSTCGGTTSGAQEVWRTPGAAYLRPVSDRIGHSDRYYCEASPRYRWTRKLSTAQLDAALETYLARYAAVPGRQPGSARRLAVESRTGSGRVGVMSIVTDRGTFSLEGDEIRYVMREPGGEILPSTYFSVEAEPGRDGRISSVTFRGRGNGHGVGMCQWGAIGRARAGQSFRAILGTYYPGTTVGPVQ